MKEFCDKCGFEFMRFFLTGKYLYHLKSNGKKYCGYCMTHIRKNCDFKKRG